MRKLTEQQIRLIFALGHEVQYMRVKLSMAQIISNYPQKKESRHPIINFALTHAEAGIVEWLVLRFSEAFGILNRASIQFLNKELFSKKGRIYKSKQFKEIVHLFHVRDEYIAHRIANLHQDSGTFKKIKEEYGSIFKFLDRIINLIEKTIEELKGQNIYKNIGTLQASCQAVKEFTENDLKQLILVSNALVEGKDLLSPNHNIQRT